METLLFKKTTDADLSKGLKVFYRDTFGKYTLIGIITDIEPHEGYILYRVDNVLYAADELKLIEIDNFDSLKEQVAATGNFIRVTERLFEYALCVLPPIYLKNGCFQIGECYSGNLYYTFGEKNGFYYGCLCNKNFALNNF